MKIGKVKTSKKQKLGIVLGFLLVGLILAGVRLSNSCGFVDKVDATTYISLSTKELACRSDIVVSGKVLEQATKNYKDNPNVSSDYLRQHNLETAVYEEAIFEINEILYNQLGIDPSTTTIKVARTVFISKDENSVGVAGVPNDFALNTGDSYVLFLNLNKQALNGYYTALTPQGIYTVNGSAVKSGLGEATTLEELKTLLRKLSN